MGMDDVLLLYRVIWEKGDMFSIFLAYGGTLVWAYSMFECFFCKKEILENDSVEVQTSKERENKKIDRESWQFSITLFVILAYHWYKFGLNDLLIKMIFQNMYG